MVRRSLYETIAPGQRAGSLRRTEDVEGSWKSRMAPYGRSDRCRCVEMETWNLFEVSVQAIDATIVFKRQGRDQQI